MILERSPHRRVDHDEIQRAYLASLRSLGGLGEYLPKTIIVAR